MFELMMIFIVFYIFAVWIYVPIYLYKKRYDYFLEGMSWPPLRPLVGFYIYIGDVRIKVYIFY